MERPEAVERELLRCESALVVNAAKRADRLGIARPRLRDELRIALARAVKHADRQDVAPRPRCGLGDRGDQCAGNGETGVREDERPRLGKRNVRSRVQKHIEVERCPLARVIAFPPRGCRHDDREYSTAATLQTQRRAGLGLSTLELRFESSTIRSWP